MIDLHVTDVMTHFVVTLRPDDTIATAARRLLSNGISGAPVVEDGRVVGVVSELDLLDAYASPLGRATAFAPPHPLIRLLRGDVSRDAAGITVSSVMTRRVVAIAPDATIVEAAALIDRHGVRRLPVIDEEGRLAGIVARSDLVRCMARSSEPRVGASADSATGTSAHA
jgi:CBS domain-containing protein